ncbi:MAG: hypothetical protein K6C94_06155 [Candidatus Gastranaerophilales bacterium]|nr:hypothetical protein [Candidatus Gastranaerophilales bacterium]
MANVNNSYMGKLQNALKNGEITYTGGAAKNVEINLGKGDADIDVRGSHVTINTGTGNQRVQVLGDDVDVALDQNAEQDWDFSQDWDAVAVVSDVDTGKIKVNMGDGGGVALAVGNDITINYGDATDKQQQVAVVWGSEEAVADIKYGEGGARYAATLDKAATNGAWSLLEDNFIDQGQMSNVVLDAAVDAMDELSIRGLAPKEIEEYNADLSTTNKTQFLNDLKAKYNLDQEQYNKISELFDSGELFATIEGTTTPKYAILTSGVLKDGNQPKYELARIDSYDPATGHIHAWGYGYDSNGTKKAVADFKDCIATNQTIGTVKQTELRTFNIEKHDVYDILRTQKYVMGGMKQITITGGDAKYNAVDITVNDKYADAKTTVTFGNTSEKSDIKIGGAYSWETREFLTRREEESGYIWGMLGQTDGTTTYQSPIVIDFNKDGKVDAAARKGVDIDGDGRADGAATGGDKMLAMSDMTGNGKVDGAEVFGNKTVNPFTGKAVNAANGFEALKVIAKDAEAATGIRCYQNGEVDLQALKEALATVGVKLGFVSDDNVTEVEELTGITAINVDEYTEAAEQGAVQHRQQGTYTDENGEVYKADDVWFETQRKKQNFFE